MKKKKKKTVNQKNYKKKLKPFIKMDKKFAKFHDTEI